MSKVEIEEKSYLEMLDKINAYDRAIEQCKLIRCDLNNAYSWINGYKKENERLNNIIKEVREYIEKNKQKTIPAYGDNFDDDFDIALDEEDIDNMLEILDKGE